MKNKKGFTLVELLAVIVILALIMSIAVVSIGGVLQSTRENTFRESAISMIDGVRKQLLVNNALNAGTYYFTQATLEKGGVESPLGGNIKYATFDSSTMTKIGTMIYKTTTNLADSVCKRETSGQAAGSYVKVTLDSTTNVFTYSICLLTNSTTAPFIKLQTEQTLISGTGDWLNR